MSELIDGHFLTSKASVRNIIYKIESRIQDLFLLIYNLYTSFPLDVTIIVHSKEGRSVFRSTLTHINCPYVFTLYLLVQRLTKFKAFKSYLEKIKAVRRLVLSSTLQAKG